MSSKPWRSRAVLKTSLEPPESENVLENQRRPSGMKKKPILKGSAFLGPDARVAQLGAIMPGGEQAFPSYPRFENGEWDLSTAMGDIDALEVVRLVRGKSATEIDRVRYIKVGGLHPRNLVTYKTPHDDFEEHCSIVVDTRFCDPRTEKAREHWEAPETKKCLNKAVVEVVKCI